MVKGQNLEQQRDQQTSAEASSVDERLDHGIKESFPGSDPVSVKVSKYAPGDSREAAETVKSATDTVGDIVDEAWNSITDRAGDSAATLAKGFRQAAPAIRRQRDLITGAARSHPVTTAVIAGLIGCGVALVAYEAFSQSKPEKLKRRAYGADETS